MKHMEFNDRTWEKLLLHIEEGAIVPILGPELLVMDMNEGPVTLYTVLASRLAQRLGVNTALPAGRYTLSDVANDFAKKGGDPEDVYFELRRIMVSQEWKTPGPLLKLASIRHFKLFLSTTFDNFLKNAIDTIRFGGADRTVQLVFSNKRAIEDLPTITHEGESPVVYKLYGTISASADYVVTEEDQLVFSHHLQMPDDRPANLFDVLKRSYLLNIGCNFPDWLTRFFFYGAKGDKLLSDGSRGIIADKESLHNDSLVGFLERSKTHLYPQAGAVEFVDELYRRWQERYGKKTNANTASDKPDTSGDALPDCPDDAVFISYASEDLAEAEKLRDCLSQNRLDVWFDKCNLEWGDDYQAKILRNIEKCSFFIPVISRHTTVPGRRFFRSEWNKAIAEAQFRQSDYPFILPVVLDSTSPSDPSIPEQFRSRHWVGFENGSIPDAFIQMIKNRIKEIRRHVKEAAL